MDSSLNMPPPTKYLFAEMAREALPSSSKEALPAIFSNSLQPQTHPALDTLMSVFVTHAVDPWDFHVVPKYSDWKMKSDEETCWMELATLVETMSQFYEKMEPIESPELVINQLVAVAWTPFSFIISGEFTGGENENEPHAEWYRAVILDKKKSTKDTDPKDTVKLYLIDIGKVFETYACKILPLSYLFTDSPPMAYKCRLFGISPVHSKWTERACDKFCEWTENVEGIAYVLNTNIPSQNEKEWELALNQDRNILSEEEQYYTIELRIRTDAEEYSSESSSEESLTETKVPLVPKVRVPKVPKVRNPVFESVGEILAKGGLGLAWNLFPARPWIFRTIKDSSAVILFQRSLQSTGELERIKEIEKLRVESKFSDASLRRIKEIMEFTGGGTHRELFKGNKDGRNIKYEINNLVLNYYGK